MQTVSQDYRNSMKSPLRNRGYIRVSMGLINKDAQDSAYISNEQGNYFSNSTKVFRGNENPKVYVTMENNHSKVDGSMYFPWKPSQGGYTYYNGFVSVGLAPCDVVITLSGSQNFKGLMIDFGENYPTKFDIITNNTTLNIPSNTQALYKTDKSFTGINKVTLKIHQMKNPNTRVRIFSMKFGMGLEYGNESVLDSSLDTCVSPISAELPQIDFTVKIKNENGSFDVENPESMVNFIESEQDMEVEYGYQLDNGNIEWVYGSNLKCGNWSSNDRELTLEAHDILRDKNAEHVDGECLTNGSTTYSVLATRVLKEMGITDYYIDPSLSNLETHNPIPRVSSKEALQLIANAGMCTLSITRRGRVELRKYDTQLENFTIEKSDILNAPNITKSDTIRKIILSYYNYVPTTDVTSLISEKVTVNHTDRVSYYFDEPYYDYTVTGITDYSIIKARAYYLEVEYRTTGTHEIEITGKKYNKVEKRVSRTINEKGVDINWSNPLIDNSSHANLLAAWLALYYKDQFQYEYETRGNPELDTMDVITQQNDYISGMKVRVTRHVIKFKQSFRGKLVTRRLR